MVCVAWTLKSGSAKPASSSTARYWSMGIGPEMQPAHESSCFLVVGSSGSSSTMSATAKRPPGRKTRNASLMTAPLSSARLMTQFEITTSTDASGRGTFSMVPLRNVALLTPDRSRLALASASISSVMSTPYAWPPGATRLAESKTSRPAPDPRSSTSCPGSSCASMVGLPQPRLTDSLSPIAFRSSAEYEPLHPQSGPSAWQHPAPASPAGLGMTAICLATLAYRVRTASRTSLIGPRLLPIDGCRWVDSSTTHRHLSMDCVQSRRGGQGAPGHPSARGVLRASRRRRRLGGADGDAHEGPGRSDPADDGRFIVEGGGAHLHL